METPSKSRRSGLNQQGNPGSGDQSRAQPEVQVKFGLVLLGEDASAERVQQAWGSILAATLDQSVNVSSELESLKITDIGNKEGSTSVPTSSPPVPASERSVAGRSSGRSPKPQVAQRQSGLVGIAFLEISRADNLPRKLNGEPLDYNNRLTRHSISDTYRL